MVVTCVLREPQLAGSCNRQVYATDGAAGVHSARYGGAPAVVHDVRQSVGAGPDWFAPQKYHHRDLCGMLTPETWIWWENGTMGKSGHVAGSTMTMGKAGWKTNDRIVTLTSRHNGCGTAAFPQLTINDHRDGSSTGESLKS